MEKLSEITIDIPSEINLLHFYGQEEANLRFLQDALEIKFIARGNMLKIIGTEKEIHTADEVIADLLSVLKKNGQITKPDMETAVRISRAYAANSDGRVKNSGSFDLQLFTNKGVIRPKSEGQEQLISSLKKNDIVFAVGPAGTGKTYLAVAMAAAALKEERVGKIILARPAVEAGESLGFLPGDFKEKIDPYLKPLYDALEDMLPRNILKKYLEQQVIEILPLAYMRGRTLNNAFVILDEAQNSTFTQMKMFLTRLGYNSKAIVTGDITQIDLPSKKNSGLISSIHVLEGIRGISFIYLSREDVVRHYLVREIIDAYDKFDEESES